MALVVPGLDSESHFEITGGEAGRVSASYRRAATAADSA